MNSAFRAVKEAVRKSPEAILAEFGVKGKKEGKKLTAEWNTGFLCPLCNDQSGSASFSQGLHLICHQCGAGSQGHKGLDVFDWASRFLGKSPWDVCKHIADRLNVSLPKVKRPAQGVRSMPSRMTADVLNAAQIDLWEDYHAKSAREELQRRGFGDQLQLVRLGIGWIRGWIIFTTRDAGGRLHERYRGWNPLASRGNAKWQWFGHAKGTGGVGFWPSTPPEGEGPVLLCEGEGDTLTAIVRLRLPYHCVTWTAGASSFPAPNELPTWLRNREVHVAYDNDVFQGPDYASYAVVTAPGKLPDHARQAMQNRLRILLGRLCPTLASAGNKVVLRKCPIDPHKNFGGDLRDWADAGGRDFEGEWTPFPFENLPDYTRPVKDVVFVDVFEQFDDTPVRTAMQVETVGHNTLTIPQVMQMDCAMGQHASCAVCPGARRFPDGVVDLDPYQSELAQALSSKNPKEVIKELVIKAPRSCPGLDLATVQGRRGAHWTAYDADDPTHASLTVFSSDQPSLSGELEVEGSVFNNRLGSGVVLMASKVRSQDTAVDMSEFHNDFLQETPAFTNDIDTLWEYFETRWRDLSANVTKIYGRRDVQIAFDLLLHSTLLLPLSGKALRGWLDICVLGDTRTGKSETFRRCMQHVRMGVVQASTGNVSRAGMMMGASRDGLLKPGAFPRNDGKLMLFDEAHHMFRHLRTPADGRPMAWMQDPRDQGIAHGMKIYGDRSLLARVRLALISNWIGRKSSTFIFPCQHLAALYETPESLARLDFGVVVQGRPTETSLPEAEHFWTAPRARALAQRAWSQEPHHVFIDEQAEIMARERCAAWATVYDDDKVPLFTVEEKWVSVLRVAAAAANVSYSHKGKDLLSVHVRPVHVEFACQWLEHTWELSSYGAYSASARKSQNVVNPKMAERTVLCDTNTRSPEAAQVLIEQLSEPFTVQELQTILGLEQNVANGWLRRMQNYRVFERSRWDGRTTYLPTGGGKEFLRELQDIAQQLDQGEWDSYWGALMAKQDIGGLFPMNGRQESEATPF